MNSSLSIISINYNNSSGLEKTIVSVINQTYKNYEYIIVDGLSDDGSIDIIKKYESEITHSVIEADNGIYHAMNKGIRFAKGDYIIFLNSGDVFTDNTVLNSVIQEIKNEDFISCNLMLVSPVGKSLKIYPDFPTFKYFLEDSLPHPATFIKRSLFDISGGYDERFKICSDWMFFIIMLCKHDATHKHLPVTLSEFQLDGKSSLVENLELIKNERKQILEAHFSRYTDLIQEWQENKKYRFIHENSRLIQIAKKLGFLNPPDSSAF